MTSTAYRRGAAFENRVKDDMEDAGYYVMRSAGSQGVADLIALDMLLPAERPVMIQCKLDTGVMSVDAWNRFLDVAVLCGAVPLLAMEDPKPLRNYSFMEIRIRRMPRSSIKPWRPWCLDAGRDAPVLDAVLGPSMGHTREEREAAWRVPVLDPSALTDDPDQH